MLMYDLYIYIQINNIQSILLQYMFILQIYAADAILHFLK